MQAGIVLQLFGQQFNETANLGTGMPTFAKHYLYRHGFRLKVLQQAVQTAVSQFIGYLIGQYMNNAQISSRRINGSLVG